MASKLILITLFFAAVVAAASARPRFLAIPIEDIEFLNGPAPYPRFQVPTHRVRRDAQEPEASASAPRSGGGASAYGGSDYVDYGAYTGGQGAFGWYSDHPVGNYGSSY